MCIRDRGSADAEHGKHSQQDAHKALACDHTGTEQGAAGGLLFLEPVSYTHLDVYKRQPFITTIVDACSLILYFQIAQLVFHNMM